MDKRFYIPTTEYPILSVQEILDLYDCLEEYSFEKDSIHTEQLLHKPLSAFDSLRFGVPRKSCRGFNMLFDETKKSYVLVLYRPATALDWKIAWEFCQVLAKFLRSEVQEKKDSGKLVQAAPICEEQMVKDDLETMLQKEQWIFYGLCRDIYMSSDRVAQILVDHEMDFDKWMFERQYGEFFEPKMMFYEDEKGNVIGNYAFAIDNPVLLPRIPFVPQEHQGYIEKSSVAEWFVHFAFFSDREIEPIGKMSFNDFMEHIPKDKLRIFDDLYYSVEPLTKPEIEFLLSC